MIKAKKDGNSYTDRKYVKRAGHTLWTGVLIAFEAVTGIKESKRNRVKFSDYTKKVAELHVKKPPYSLQDAYDILHLHMGYDGVLNFNAVQNGKNIAIKLIDWCEQILKQKGKR